MFSNSTNPTQHTAQHVIFKFQQSSDGAQTQTQLIQLEERLQSVDVSSSDRQVLESPTSSTRRLSSDHQLLSSTVTSTTSTTDNIIEPKQLELNQKQGTAIDTYITKSWTTTPSYPTYTSPAPSVRSSSSTYQRRLATRSDSMRFQTTVRPVLTPLGQRLINISERKLYDLEAPIGGRDVPTLLKDVLVREAVRSAWRSVHNGQQVQVTDWQSDNAMGLDVIGEEEEEEDEDAREAEQGYHNSVVEQRGERWFEELVQSFGEDESVESHEWIESEVGAPFDYDDFEYEDFEHYTLPSSPPVSPIQAPSSPPTPLESPSMSTIELSIEAQDVPASSSGSSYFDEVKVPDYDDGQLDYQEVTSAPVSRSYLPSTPLLSATFSPSSSPIPLISLTNDELDCDDLSLPPPLHRCSSSTSVPCECEDFDSNGSCATPTSSCEDLELSVGSLSLGDSVLQSPGDSLLFALDKAAVKPNVEKWRTWDEPPLPPPSGSFGLGLEISLDLVASD